MQKKLRILCLFMAILLTAGAKARVIHLLPRPQKVTVKHDKHFTLYRSVRLLDPTNCALLRTFLAENKCKINEKAKSIVEVQLVNSIEDAAEPSFHGFQNEAYSISVKADRITIRAVSPIGVIRAAQTLRQMAEGYKATTAIEAVEITDWPASKVRAMMLDVARAFIPINSLRQHITLLSRYKINVVQLHLTDNEAWRMQVKAYPQLTKSAAMTRDAGSFYTQDQLRSLDSLANENGMMIIPEITMPLSDGAFQRAMGHAMLSDDGVDEVKTILGEVANVFPKSPYLHIGFGKTGAKNAHFIDELTTFVNNMERSWAIWGVKEGSNGATLKMQNATAVVPTLSLSRMDVFADLLHFYNNPDKNAAGMMAAVWNNHRLSSVSDIVKANNLYPVALVLAAKTWQSETSSDNRNLDEMGDFSTFEPILLYHLTHVLASQPCSYVRQSNITWRVTQPIPNGGDAKKELDPELIGPQNAYEIAGVAYSTHDVVGAGCNLLSQNDNVSQSFGNTVYAWTYVWSPQTQKVGAMIDFHNYDRSLAETKPNYGSWDCMGSKIWLNDVEILPVVWRHHDALVPLEEPLSDENLTLREPLVLHLNEGWNKVFVKLPFVKTSAYAVPQWRFTFVITDKAGSQALQGIIYSPAKEKK